MKKCSIVRNVRLFDCLVVLVTVLSVRCATAGVFGIEPEGQRPVAKDGMRVYMGVDRTFDESEAKCAAYARGPATFTLTIQPKGRDK